MSEALHRRRFLQGTAASAVAAATASSAAETASATVVVGVMGVNGRGAALARGFAAQKNCRVGYLCDVDESALARTANSLKDQPALKTTGDFEEILDDSSVDALVIAAPDHWHAPATILACRAGKHVYVEKPCSHNGREGELALAAARKHNRVVTMGTQRRSWPAIVEGMQKLHEGEIGRVLYSRSWYNNRRPSIGKGRESAPPAGLDFDLWQGSAPRRPFRSNLVHYHWHPTPITEIRVVAA